MNAKIIIRKSEKSNTAVKFINEKDVETVIKRIDTDVQLSKTTDKEYDGVHRLISQRTCIILESKDNGDYVIYTMTPEYPYKAELIKAVEEYAETNGLLFTKI